MRKRFLGQEVFLKKTASQKLDSRLARQARKKIALGQKPRTGELSALKRVERIEEEESRWHHYQTIPKKHWIEMSGLTSMQLHRAADNFGVPLRGRKIDLPSVVAWLHRFLTDTDIPSQDGDTLLVGPKTASLERLRRAQAEKIELQNALTRGQLCRTDEINHVFDLMATELRRASGDLRKRFGEEAHEVLADAIRRTETLLDRLGKSAIGTKDARNASSS